MFNVFVTGKIISFYISVIFYSLTHIWIIKAQYNYNILWDTCIQLNLQQKNIIIFHLYPVHIRWATKKEMSSKYSGTEINKARSYVDNKWECTYIYFVANEDEKRKSVLYFVLHSRLFQGCLAKVTDLHFFWSPQPSLHSQTQPALRLVVRPMVYRRPKSNGCWRTDKLSTPFQD